MRWLKLYEFITEDDKVRKLTAAEFRLYIAALCLLRRIGHGYGAAILPLPMLSYHARLSRRNVERGLRRLHEVGLLATEMEAEKDKAAINCRKWHIHQAEVIKKQRHFVINVIPRSIQKKVTEIEEKGY